MTLTDVEAVRLKASDKSVIEREKVVTSGEDQYYKLSNTNILASPAPSITLDGVPQTEGVDYTIDYAQGVVSWVAVLTVNRSLEFTYYWSVFSDTEIQYFLDEAGGNVTIATAKLLLAWAADAARLAKRQTLSGGGGLGQVVIDTSVAAKELRATAKALIDTEADLGESIPAEGLTEIPWTEQVYHRQVDQHFIRES
jgi:hypothetical protein